MVVGRAGSPTYRYSYCYFNGLFLSSIEVYNNIKRVSVMSFYRRHLPHWQPENAVYFVTFRLAGSLPVSAVARLKRKRMEMIRQLSRESDEKNFYISPIPVSDRKSILRSYIEMKIFRAYEDLLDDRNYGPYWLSKSNIAEIVREALAYRNHKKYELYAYSIMPNHVHLVLKLLPHNLNNNGQIDYPLTNVLQGLKSYSGLVANRSLHRCGSFWQSESYDHGVRNLDELERVITYTLNNPVKAGLVEHWEDWPYSYCNPGFLPDL